MLASAKFFITKVSLSGQGPSGVNALQVRASELQLIASHQASSLPSNYDFDNNS